MLIFHIVVLHNFRSSQNISSLFHNFFQFWLLFHSSFLKMNMIVRVFYNLYVIIFIYLTTNVTSQNIKMQAEISPTQHTHRIFENRENQWKQRLVQEPEPVRVGVCQCVRDTGTRENGRVLCCVRGLSILLNIEPLSLSGLSLGIGKSGLFKWWKKREIVFYTKNEK